jgi:hypothetical protein
MKINNLEVVKAGLDYYFTRAVKANLSENNADKLTGNGLRGIAGLIEQILLSMTFDLRKDYKIKLKGLKVNELVADLYEILKTIEQ